MMAFLGWSLLWTLLFLLNAAAHLELDVIYWTSILGALMVGYVLSGISRRQKTAPQDVGHSPRPHEDRVKEEPRQKDGATQTEQSSQPQHSGKRDSASLRDAATQTNERYEDKGSPTPPLGGLQEQEQPDQGPESTEKASARTWKTVPLIPLKRRPAAYGKKANPYTAGFSTDFEERFRDVEWEWQEGQGVRKWQKLSACDKVFVGRKLQRRLLTLPPELRNQIWREVLLFPAPLLVNGPSGPLMQPGLLRVSKALRQEASGIWYMENEFIVQIDDFDATAWKRWRNSALYRKEAPTCLRIPASTNWSNLKQWLKDVLEGQSAGITEPPASDADHIKLLWQLLQVVKREYEAKAGWNEVEERLEDIRKAMGWVNMAWRGQ